MELTTNDDGKGLNSLDSFRIFLSIALDLLGLLSGLVGFFASLINFPQKSSD